MSNPFAARARELLAPQSPPDCWTWLQQHLATAPASEGGRRFDLRRAGLFRHWHDVISARLFGKSPAHDPYAHETQHLWFTGAAQLGKDRAFLNATLAYVIDAWPRPIGYLMPRSRDLSKLKRGRLQPLIEKTPRLVRHLPISAAARSEAITGTLLTLGSAFVYLLAGQVANDLRSHPLRLVLANEFDVYPANCQDEGDPIELVDNRSKSWPRDRLLVGATTPTAIASHGWKRLTQGTHERPLIACPHCGGLDWLNPDQLRAPEDAPAAALVTEDLARWFCRWCGAGLTSTEKDHAVARAAAARGLTAAGGWCAGRWTIGVDHPDGCWTPAATLDDRGHLVDWHPPRALVRSGWMNSLYSPDCTLGAFLANERLAEAGDELQKLTHRNTWRGDPAAPRVSAAVAPESLTKSCQQYPLRTAPEQALRLLIACDQQGNSIDGASFPFVARAYGAGGESWLVDSGEVHGWAELESLELRAYVIGGESRVPDAVLLDGRNGNLRVRIQQWSAGNPRVRLVLGGVRFLGQPWVKRSNAANREKRNKRIVAGAQVYHYDSQSWRNELDERIQNAQRLGYAERIGEFRAVLLERVRAAEAGEPIPPLPTPPWHLPHDVPDHHLASLTAEERVPELVNVPGEGRRLVPVWKPRAIYDERGEITYRSDNHWWDAEVMALVGADILKWPTLTPPDPPPQATAAPAHQPAQVAGGEPWIDVGSW